MREMPIQIEGFEGRNLLFKDEGFFKSAKVFIDGNLVKTKFGRFKLTDNSGKAVEGRLDYNFFNCGSFIAIAGRKIEIQAPLRILDSIFCCWPLILILLGGAIGGGLGGLATVLNIGLFRSKVNPALKYILSIIISLSAIFIWYALAMAINQKIHPVKP